MIRPISGWCAATLFCSLIPLAAPDLDGQTPPPASQSDQGAENTVKLKRLAVGLHARLFPLRPDSTMGRGQAMSTSVVSNVTYDFDYNTGSRTPFYGGGVTLEYTMGPRTSLVMEGLFNQLRFAQNIDAYWGVDNPETATDDRTHQSAVQTTSARLWDVPLMVRHKGVRSSGFLSHMFVAAGVTDRFVSNIGTTTDTTLNGTTTTARTALSASKKNLLGVVVGAGFQFIDDFGIRVTPEIRYTRWAGRTFASDSVQSPTNQFEVGISISH
jgi:hypothetical protein